MFDYSNLPESISYKLPLQIVFHLFQSFKYFSFFHILQGRKFAMTILLPSPKNNLTKLIESLESNVIQREQYQLYETNVRVVLPKFKFDRTSVLNSALQYVSLRKKNQIFDIK